MKWFGLLIYEILKGIGISFGLDGWDWLAAILSILLFLVTIVIVYALLLYLYYTIKSWLTNSSSSGNKNNK